MKHDGRIEFEGRIVRLEVRQVTLPNNHRMEIEVVHHPGGSGIVAVNDRHEICLLRQYRPVFDDWLWEIPAGKRDHEEPPLETAQRELAEEAGVTAGRWTDLGVMISSPGVFSEKVWLYLARDLHPVAAENAVDEILEVHWMPVDEARSRCLDGRFLDAKTVIAILRAAPIIRESAGER